MRTLFSWCIAMGLSVVATTASALPATFVIEQIYSNADATVQFVVIFDRGHSDCDSGENVWAGQTLISTGPGPQKTFAFPTDLPTCATSQRRILIATSGFAALGIISPDYVIPNGFLQIPNGTLSFAGVSQVTYTALPYDGVTSILADGTPIQNLATNLAGATASVVPASVSLNQHGLTGSWYEGATGGQGIEVEVFPDPSSGTGSTFVSWFTYDTVIGGAEHQRWYTAQGPVVTGQPNAALTIYQNTGGNFNEAPVTNAQAVGTATLSFDTCSSGQLSYTFTDGTSRTGAIPLTRLTQNVTCSTTSPHPTNGDFALSGNWFGGAATSGQGFTAEVNPNSGVFFAAWYTYMPNGAAAGAAGQRWYTAQGAFTPGLRSIPVTIYETSGGKFDTPTPPGQKTVAVGTGTMAFQSCAAATFNYSFTDGSSHGLSGTIALSRVGPVPPGCAP